MPDNGKSQAGGLPLPLYVDMTGKRTLVVGGGCVAQRKVETLVAHGCNVTVVSPRVSEKLDQLEASGSVRIERRGFAARDVAGCFLVFACTDSRDLNALVATAAAEAGALVNCADTNEPEVSVPATVTRGKLQIAVSTEGSSPALARKIRQELQERFDEAYGPYLELLGETREIILAEVPRPKERHAMNRAILDDTVLESIREGDAPTPRALFEFARKALRSQTEE